MVLPLPGALASFSTAALKNISALGAITKSIAAIQGTVSKNITAAATAATTGPGSLFADIPDFVAESNDRFLQNIALPPSLSTGQQQASFNAISGIPSPTGSQVNAFVSDNVRLEDVLPAQQIYQISKNLGNTSMYADPMQAYTNVAAGSAQIKNLCTEAEAIIAQIQQDLADLLSVQVNINYSQYAAMGPQFFIGAQSRINDAIGAFGILCTQLDVRGKFDGAAVTAFCTAVEAFQNFVTFASAKVEQFDRLRKDVQAGLKRLSQILAELLTVTKAMSKFIPTYVASTAFGALFRSLQKKVCDQANIDLQKILNDVEAFSSANADDKAKVTANFAWAGSLESIKAFVCGLQPSTEVTNPVGEFAPLSAAYDIFSASLIANDPTASFEVFLTQIPTLAASMATGVIQDNSGDLSSAASSILGTLAGITLSLTAICASATTFKGVFVAETSLDPDRLVGSMSLYESIGADNAKNASLLNAGDTTALPVSESTTPGQLAESMKVRIDQMPDGHEKEQLTILYEKVQARHRATVLAMDLQRRQDSATAFAVDEAEANRQLVNKTVATFSGLDADEFDEFDVS
jgi:hypothetical protein